jgi:hypothetical protein
MLRAAVHVSPGLFVLLSLVTACGDDGPQGASTASAATSTTATTDAGTSSTGGEGSTSGTSSSTTVAPTSGSDTTAQTGTVGETTSSESTSSAGTSTSGDTTAETTGESSGTTGGALSGEVRVLQLNLCHSGVAGCFTGDAVMTKAVSVITDVAPALVTLNEVCRKDVPWLAAQTGAVDHRFTPALKADDTPVKCKNGDDYGNGLLSWLPAAWDAPVTGVYGAQSSQTERRVWICMGYAGVVGCTTHLSTDGATALAQCKEFVGGPLATAAADGPAVMAGDWNLKYKGSPDAQDCVAGGFFRKGDGSVQHVIAADEFGFIETITIDMDGTTDHPGLEVRLTLP